MTKADKHIILYLVSYISYLITDEIRLALIKTDKHTRSRAVYKLSFPLNDPISYLMPFFSTRPVNCEVFFCGKVGGKKRIPKGCE